MPIFRDKESWTFLLLIVPSNAAFIYLASVEIIPLGLYNLGRFALLGALLVIVAWSYRRWTGLWSLVQPLSIHRARLGWLLLALALPPGIALLTLGAKGLLLGTGLSEIDATLDIVTSRSLWPILLFASFVGEIVWVSYAIGRLSKNASVLVASWIVGLFWSLWWVPMVMLGEGVIAGVTIIGAFISMFGAATMQGFVYGNTRSGLVALTLQLSFNSSLLIFPISPQFGGQSMFLIYCAVYFLTALLLFVLFGPRPLFSLKSEPLQSYSPSAT